MLFMKWIRSTSDKIITHSTRFFDTDMEYVFKGSFWLTLVRAVSALCSLFLAIAFAHFLSKENYGVYKYILSVAGLLSAFSLSGLSTAIVQSVARGFDGIFKQSLKINLTWSAGMIASALFLALYYAFKDNYILALGMLVVAIFAPILNGTLLYKSYLNGKKEFQATAWYGIVTTIIPSIVVLAGIIITSNPFYIIIFYFVSNTLVNYVIYLHVVDHYRPNSNLDPESLRYSKHLSIVNILDVLATNLDKVLLFQHLGASSLSVYSFAIALPEQLRNVMQTIPILAIPKLSEKTTEEIQHVIYKKIFKLSFITIPIIVIYFFAAPFLYKFLFPQYIESIPYSQFFAIILLVEGGLAGSVFKAQRALKEQYVLNVSNNIIQIILLFVLMILYGIWGIIIARILSRYISFIISFILLKKMK